MIGADTAQDVFPNPYSGIRAPVHIVGLVAMGRFAEAVASWDQWDRLAGRSPEEESQRADVERARQAARVFVHG